MMKNLITAICLAAASTANAWSWFGLAPYDEADTNRPPRLHRLLEKANDLMEQADEDAMNGDGDKALEHYREALEELQRVERENPKRAETAEFAPLRNKKATCSAAIETIRFAQINENQRAVTVSDSAELRKKYNKKHGIDPEKEEKPKPPDAADLMALNQARDEAKDKSWKERLKQSYDFVKKRDYAAADALLEKLLEEKPTNLEALLLKAAAQCGMGSVYAARRTYEKANRAHPKSYVPYYNLAHVALLLGEGEDAAREYYNLGRAVGGPKDERLEKRIGGKEAKK